MEIHPVDLLVDLVLADEKDPWEIDVADIANKFLEKVREMSEVDLKLSGRVVLASSILLKMKSDAMMPPEEPECVLDVFPYDLADGIGNGNGRADGLPFLAIPARRRAERKATLFELIEALQRALSEEIIRKNFPKELRRRKIVVPLDEQGIEEKIAEIYSRIKELAAAGGVIKFSELLRERSRDAIVEAVLSILFLASDGKISLWQEELFGEIFITLGEIGG